ncbi:non-hydrolyzing UDP-N-acetylglucosamine 2-epimerase [Pelotomaculum propionicicum]|uniref:non-hydrolyzing UDP-N-acetylglucosamine 2-epimerase n=1 Tax=Pelotomaculum propionicicum TaxID=258475 RepID=UPI003B783CC7
MKVVTVVGARPQFIKAAAVSRSIRKYNLENPVNQIEENIVHTGQHYDHNMSQVFFKELDIPNPNYNLGIGSGQHGEQTGRMLEAVEKVLENEKPDWLLVYGDTNSTLAGALAAAKMHIPVAHVEAGLRSYNRKMPEEINRVLTDHVSKLLLCPTTTAVENLRREGILSGVHQVGDVMFDCMLYYRSKLKEHTPLLKALRVELGYYVLATVHRAENTDSLDKLREIFEAFAEISEQMPVLVALHPRTRKYLQNYGIKVAAGVRLLEPVPYLQMVELECNARVIMTDSGGIQKEAFFVGTPCITLREETEWVETVDCGANILCGASSSRIMDAYKNIENINPDNEMVFKLYGNGKASDEIINLLVGI